MRFRTAIFILLLAAGSAWAQGPAAGTAAAPLPPVAGARNLTILKPVTNRIGEANNAHLRAVHAALQAGAGGAQPAASIAPGKPPTLVVRGKRDPFVSMISIDSGQPNPACASGKQCLAVAQIVLRGIVRTPSGSIAIVENGLRKAYFLRENDPVFNATLIRITQDSVVFREKVVDRAGHVGAREVVKRLAKPS